jgi:hypothetical protein
MAMTEVVDERWPHLTAKQLHQLFDRELLGLDFDNRNGTYTPRPTKKFCILMFGRLGEHPKTNNSRLQVLSALHWDDKAQTDRLVSLAKKHAESNAKKPSPGPPLTASELAEMERLQKTAKRSVIDNLKKKTLWQFLDECDKFCHVKGMSLVDRLRLAFDLSKPEMDHVDYDDEARSNDEQPETDEARAPTSAKKNKRVRPSTPRSTPTPTPKEKSTSKETTPRVRHDDGAESAPRVPVGGRLIVAFTSSLCDDSRERKFFASMKRPVPTVV